MFAIVFNKCVYAYCISSTKRGTFIEAFLTWQVSSDNNCGVNANERIVPTDVQIGVQEPTRYRLGDHCFRSWPQDGDQRPKITNYMGVLTLGWSYIFSACLIEMQSRDGAAVSHTDFTAVGYHSSVEDLSSPTVPVYIGEMDVCAAQS